ncbi:uncharacterized protein [Eleutherodactylus coqui]|uniref:uncharacterized protein n=1 Tax=Eleutherodactylus coqui TaxID=57060 RepID=UPI003461AC24
MKSIAIFMLVGLSLFSNGLCSDEDADGSSTFMGISPKGRPTLMNRVIKPSCYYDEMNPGDEANTKLNEAVSGKLQTILDKFGLKKIVLESLCEILIGVQNLMPVMTKMISHQPRSEEGLTNTAGTLVSNIKQLDCACQIKPPTLDQIIKPLNNLYPGMAQTLSALKQAILGLPADVQELAGNTCASAVVAVLQKLLDSLDPAVRAVGCATASD